VDHGERDGERTAVHLGVQDVLLLYVDDHREAQADPDAHVRVHDSSTDLSTDRLRWWRRRRKGRRQGHHDRDIAAAGRGDVVVAGAHWIENEANEE
jgi:hypothetical protein